MRKISVTFVATVPVEATDEQVDEWVSFELGENARISGENPLSFHNLEADFRTVIIDDA